MYNKRQTNRGQNRKAGFPKNKQQNASKSRILGQNNGMGITPSYMHKSEIVGPYSVHRLQYKSDLTTISGTPFIVKSLSVNSLFDPDPAVLSTNYAGFAWLSQAYDENLVQINRTSWWVGNNNSFISIGIVYSFERLDLSIATWQDAKDALENSFATKTIQLAPKNVGGSSRVLRSKINLADLTKAGVYQFSELYSGQATVNPPYEIWVNLIAYSNDASSAVEIFTDLSLEATIEFYSRKRLTDVATSPLLFKLSDEFTEDDRDDKRSVTINTTTSKYNTDVRVKKDFLSRGTNVRKK
jgi:hypothetical protein